MKNIVLFGLFFSPLILTDRPKIVPKHSNIYIQKIINESNKAAFIALERINAEPLHDTVDIGAPLMSGETYEMHDSEQQFYSFAIPIWQNTFRGNQFNIITLSGNPGIIYFLYEIDGHLWAVKTPEKKGDLKGIHLLDPADKERTFNLKIKDDNKLELVPISQASEEENPVQAKESAPGKQTLTKKPLVQTQPQKKRVQSASASQPRPTTQDPIRNQRPRRHMLPTNTQTRLQHALPG